MDRSVEYVQTLSNFGSAYNATADAIYKSKFRPELSSTYPRRSSSPLFHRSKSPPPPYPLFTEAAPRFNFDLYRTDETFDEEPSVIIHHRPIDSPSASPTSALSKLRRINDELCHALARSELEEPSRRKAAHYHIHHYPVSRTPPERQPAPVMVEASPKVHKARVTYKIHIPSRRRPERSARREQISQSASEEDSSREEPIVIDLYPSRDRGFQPDDEDRSPWVVKGKSLRRQSYSDTSAPSERYDDDKPIKTHRKDRLPSGLRHPFPFSTSRSRREPTNINGSHRSSLKSALHPEPWDSSGVKPPSKHILAFESPREESPKVELVKRIRKHVTEHDPIAQRRAQTDRPQIRQGDPKLQRRLAEVESKVKSTWEPTVNGITPGTVRENRRSSSSQVREPSKARIVSEPTSPVPSPSKHILAFDSPREEPPKAELVKRIRKHVTEHDPIAQRRAQTDRPQIRQGDPKLQRRLAEVESKVKSTWEPTVNGITPGTVRENRRPSSSQVKKPTKARIVSPPSTGRSSENDRSIQSITPSTPQEQSAAEPVAGDQEKKKEKPKSPPPPAVKQPEAVKSVEEKNDKPPPSDQTASEIGDAHEKQPSSAPKAPSPQPKSEAEDSDEEEGDENDQEVARSFDFNQWLRGASEAIATGSKKKDEVTPSPPPKPPALPKVAMKVTPRRKEQPPSPTPSSPDHNLYKPPLGPKKTNPPPPAAAATTTEVATPAVDDFFS